MPSTLHRIEAQLVRAARATARPVVDNRLGRFAEDTLLAARAVIRGFQGEKISLRAAALTYISIFSLVPLATVALALVQIFRQQWFNDLLQSFIHQVLAPGIREESAAYLDRYIHAASSRTAGSIGFLVLIVSAGSLLRNLDSSLNEIWNVRRKRSWPIRIVTYLLVLVVGPPFVALSLAGTAVLGNLLERAHVPFLSGVFEVGWALASVGGFALLYFVAPKARVRFRSALAGGVVAGGAWEVARLGYASFAGRSIHYNPIYGALGALPLFLIWVYLSWLLVLFGARLAYAVQHASFRGGIVELGAHPRARELIAARTAQLATLAHSGLISALQPPELATRLHVPDDTLAEILELMTQAGLIRFDEAGRVWPARPPDELTLADISFAVGGISTGLSQVLPSKSSEFQEVEQYFAPGDDAVLRRLRRVRWSHLLPPPDANAVLPLSRASGNP